MDVNEYRAQLNAFPFTEYDPAALRDYAALVAAAPAELVELALVRALYKAPEGKAVKPIMAAMVERCPSVADLIKKPPSFYDWLENGRANPWPKLKALYEQVDVLEGVDGTRFRFELFKQELVQQGARYNKATLRGALEKIPSQEVFAALGARFRELEASGRAFGRTLSLWIEGTCPAGISLVPGLDQIQLEGKHSNPDNLAELADGREPIELHYDVKAPKLANLRPIRHRITTLVCRDPKLGDLTPLLEFDRLKVLRVAEANVPRAQELLREARPDLEITS